MSVRELIIRHEGLRLIPYRDSVGKWTIGFGRNIEDNGISRDEAFLMLENDIARATNEARSFNWWEELNPARQAVVICMLYNMGLKRFRGFTQMIRALELRRYEVAAAEALNSKWANQVGYRATELAKIMRTGTFG